MNINEGTGKNTYVLSRNMLLKVLVITYITHIFTPISIDVSIAGKIYCVYTEGFNYSTNKPQDCGDGRIWQMTFSEFTNSAGKFRASRCIYLHAREQSLKESNNCQIVIKLYNIYTWIRYTPEVFKPIIQSLASD